MKAPFPASEEHRFFLEVELLFNSLRGSARLLSPADWQVARAWWHQQIPLPVVRSALENVFRQRRERGDTGRIQSLQYCESAVLNAFRHLQELGYGSHSAPEVPQESCAERLETLVGSLGEFGASHRAEILACARDTEDPALVERNLAALELALAQSARDGLHDEAKRALTEELQERVRRAVAPLEARLDPESLARTRRRTEGRILRELLEIPRLSLFS